MYAIPCLARPVAHVLEFPAVPVPGAQFHQRAQRLRVLQSARCTYKSCSYFSWAHNSFQVSWGTKGSDKAEALPSVSSKKGKSEEAVVEEATRNKEDLDAHFKETVTRALTKIEVKEVPEKPTMDDQNRTFRTRLVAFWMLSNAGLAVAIENLNGVASNNEEVNEDELRKKQNIYFSVILYSTFGLAAVRFAGVSLLRLLSSDVR